MFQVCFARSFIHLLRVLQIMIGCVLCAGHYAGDAGEVKLLVLRLEDKIKGKCQLVFLRAHPNRVCV